MSAAIYKRENTLPHEALNTPSACLQTRQDAYSLKYGRYTQKRLDIIHILACCYGSLRRLSTWHLIALPMPDISDLSKQLDGPEADPAGILNTFSIFRTMSPPRVPR